MKKYMALLSVGMFFGVSGVDLEEAIVSAYNNNAAWKSNQAMKKSADAQYSKAKAVFFPTMDASLVAARRGNDESGYILSNPGGGVDYGRDVRKSTQTHMELSLRQNVFNSFKDVNNMKSKKNSAKAVFHKLKKAEQDLIVKVVETYTAVWAERKKLQAHVKKEENLKKLYEAQEVCLGAGMSTPADVAEAESKYQSAVYERVDAETKVVEAETQFRQITGIDPDQKIFIPNLDIKLPKNLDQLEDIALKFNQEILQEKFMEKSALNDLDVARGELGPKCDVTVSAARELSKHEPRFHYNNRSQNSYEARLVVTVPILHIENHANIDVYNEKAKQAKFASEDKVLEVKRNCKVYWRAYKAAEASIRASSTAVKSAEIASERNLDQANLGMKSNTEFLDAETSLLNARIKLASSVKSKIDAMIRLFALTGTLDLRSMLDALKHNKGVLDPMAVYQAKEYARKSRKSGRKLLKKENYSSLENSSKNK